MLDMDCTPAAGILLYTGGCNWRPYNMCVVSHCTNNICQIAAQMKDIR